MISLSKIDSLPFALAVAMMSALVACAPDRDLAAGAPVDVRILVKLVRASDDAAAIGAEATRHAGVSVTYAAAASPTWHALALHCASAAECETAIERLRLTGTVYQAVEIEGRKARMAS